MSILILGAGDLATGVAVRLHRAGLRLVLTEQPQPLAVRRAAAFSEAVYEGKMTVEEVTACRADDLPAAERILAEGRIPLLVDPSAACRLILHPAALVDARLTKRPPDLGIDAAPLVIGLGPGFLPGQNCHAAVETKRGHTLGRVLWDSPPAADTGIPESVGEYSYERVLRAPADGRLQAFAAIGDRAAPGERLAAVQPSGAVIAAPFAGVVRGLLRDGQTVTRGQKIGDLDPRGDRQACFTVSDKALAVAGGVLEALLTRPEIRRQLWER